MELAGVKHLFYLCFNYFEMNIFCTVFVFLIIAIDVFFKLGKYRLLISSFVKPLTIEKHADSLDIFCYQGERGKPIYKLWTTMKV